jgi:hypothetical protein
MTNISNSEIGKIIADYIELSEMSRIYAKKRIDLEKEYNRLLTDYYGEAKNYSLEQAEMIYNVYNEMMDYEERTRIASESVLEAEQKLNEIGRILYESTIHAEVNLPAINGSPAQTRSVKVTYVNGLVNIR